MTNQQYQIAFQGLYEGLGQLANEQELAQLDKYIPDILLKKSSFSTALFQQANEILFNQSDVIPKTQRLKPLLATILNAQNNSRYSYLLAQLSAQNIFPIDKENKDTRTALWQQLLQGIEKIPSAHRANLPLWLDHFDTLCQCFMSNLLSFDEEVSLYDQTKVTTAFATALHLTENQEQPFLLIQGDFFGIQDFIFSGGSETNKQMAKLLRGRSFQVSLFTELAALKILEACELPSTSQLMNAAGKFLIIAPNNEAIKKKLAEVQTELNQWFIKHTYGLIGLGIATKSATKDQFTSANYPNLIKSLFQQLEKTKLQRLDLITTTKSVQNVEYSSGVCALNSYFPAEKNGLSKISQDQIKIGESLAKFDRLIVCDENAEIYQNQHNHILALPIFDYRIFFTQEQDITGKFSELAKTQQIKRLWDFELPQKLQQPIWNGYARRYINAYIPYMENGEPKTFDLLARVDQKEKDGRTIGQAALMTLKGDVDNLGKIFQQGIVNPNFAKMAALSRQMNQFFSLWLPAYCAESSPNMYTVFAGGDDFFLIGSWRETQELAQKMQQEFKKYVADNKEIHFSAGMVMTKVGVPVPRLGEMAEEALEQAKAIDSGKNAVTIYQQRLKWEKFEKLAALEKEIEALAKQYKISTSYLYSLIYLSEQAADTSKIENSMWRSRFYYKTNRYVIDKLDKSQKDEALKQITEIIGKNLEDEKSLIKIPLFNLFYKTRS